MNISIVRGLLSGMSIVCVCMCGFCNVSVCVCVCVCVCGCVGFVICGCFGNMCTCIYCVFISFVFVYPYLLLVRGLLPPSENSIAVNNNNNNNNKRVICQ